MFGVTCWGPNDPISSKKAFVLRIPQHPMVLFFKGVAQPATRIHQPKGKKLRKGNGTPYFRGNLGWWNIKIWPEEYTIISLARGFFSFNLGVGVEVMLFFRGHANSLPILRHHLGEYVWFANCPIAVWRVANPLAINHWWRWEMIFPNCLSQIWVSFISHYNRWWFQIFFNFHPEP